MTDDQLDSLADLYVRRIIIFTIVASLLVYSVAVVRGWPYSPLIGIGSAIAFFGISFFCSVKFLRLAKKQ